MSSIHTISRVLAILALLILLTTLTAWFGSINPNPQEYRYPDEDDLAANYNAHVGGRAQVSGTVVATDPVQISISNGVEERVLTVENLEADNYQYGSITDGESIFVFGTVEPDDVITASDAITRDPWEGEYMVLVSLLGGFVVLGRLLNGWNINLPTLTARPRQKPRIPWRGGDDG